MPREIHKTLVLSTVHITHPTAKHMENLPWPVVMSSEYAFRLVANAGLHEVDPLLKELEPLLQLARDNDCDFLILDCDGPIEDDLPTYDW
jgi:hypothetical protein